MATSASDRLKAMLAAQLNKKALNENPKANQETQPQISNPETNETVLQQKEEKLLGNKVSVADTKEEIKSLGTDLLPIVESSKQELALAEAPVSEEKSAFFDTPLGRMMQDLETALDNQLPGMASILRDIHLHMQKDVDCVTQLSDEEIGTIVRGLESIQGQTIVTNPKTGKSTGGKKAPVVASML